MDTQKIKKKIIANDKIILLYNYHIEGIPIDSLSNITCFDSQNNFLWQAEKPVTSREAYYDMWIDTASKMLIAVTGGGMQHEIDTKTGKILKSYLVK